ncbi:gustatory receptor for sugar taste 61a-like isoform X2 [Leptidea sinapis]|uniref:gustatory receptor for sugar taste 61a-like isoform X2 n=1 Tax=Leptidea sinapis TaxID=189913 RepID=UPI0021C36A66|nr:gustatory receptor for sugar taste 61a-like isoform X2 [Leptidea sinapis]
MTFLPRFVCISPYTVFCGLSFTMQLCCLGLHLSDSLRISDRIRDTEKLLLHIFLISSALYLAKFGRNWNEIFQAIKILEKRTTRIEDPKKLVKLIDTITLWGLFLFSLEIGLHLLFAIEDTKLCSDHNNITLKLFWNKFFITNHRHYFSYLPNTVFVGFTLEFLKTQIKFWDYAMNVFIIINGIYLAKQLGHLNMIMARRLQENKGNRMTWINIQMQYTTLCKLVKQVDSFLNPIVFFLYIYNLINTCKSIHELLEFKGLYKMNKGASCKQVNSNIIANVYKFYITLISLVKTVGVVLIGGKLNDLTLEPLDALQEANTSAYGVELQRFMDQVYHSRVGLSGFGCFIITRSSLLQIISAIITYELMLIQLLDVD